MVGLLLLGAPAFAGVDMQEGNWETTLHITMEGTPLPMPPTTVTATQCLTRRDLVPSAAGQGRKCTVRDRKVSGNTVTWKVLCDDDQDRSEGEGSITYAGSTYSGVIRTTVTTRGSKDTMRSTVNMKGTRIGACTR